MTNPTSIPASGLADANESLSLKEIQNQVDAWIHTVGVRYFNELTNTALLMEEVGELARIMARAYGEQSFKEGETAEQLADEMADILWVLICLANQTGVNLEAAFRKNLEKKSTRDAHRHRNNPKLNTD
jgi:NTP pyrophosphatase (non-canonical NTP hydrolase)